MSPDKPLVIKCTFNRKLKRIAFRSARNCTYDLLRSKVDQCFSLTGIPYMIAYKDDDGEISNIVTDDELSEAIDFFDDGNDDAPPSSGSSVFSGRSSSSRKITMHVEVNIEFDGRLSDTASLDDYRDDSESQISLSISSTRRELDDDDVTVSSRDYIAASHLSNGRYVLEGESLSQRISNFGWQSTSRPDPIEEGILEDLVNSSAMQTGSETAHVHVEERTLPEDEENTFEELDVISLDFDAPSVNDRHAAWLREQTSLTSRTNLNNIRDRFGPHDLSSQPDSESISGNVALEKDTRGKYYYSYTPASSNDSQEYDTFHEEHQFEEVELPHRPSSMQLAWLASQRVPQANEYITPISISSLGFNEEDVTQMTGEYEPPLPESTTSAPPEIVTECSHCGVLLETIRYVCSTCGPKPPAGTASHSYPPPPLRHPFTSSSRTLVASSSSLPNNNRDRPLPPLPSNNGYELCAECVQSYGIYHAVEGGRDPESPPISGGSTSSFMELQHSSVFHRSAPQKGKLRHAFREQMWEGNKWIDLQQGESSVRVCSMCKNETDKKRYKCAVCLKIHMCQSCYSQVHDLHPKHAFIAVPDVEMSLSFRVPLPQEEQPLLHRGVNCVHCRREIIGARFHCPFCGVDICQNCEAAGLPGNLDASNGGHDSTHIMLKIPYYLDSIKVNQLSNIARRLDISDAATAGRAFPSSVSLYPSTSHVDISTSLGSIALEQRDHQPPCSNCRQIITGTRYQCVNCPSSPFGYSLCQICEDRSYEIHDPYHVFFRLSRPVDKAIESPTPFLPIMYTEPAGPTRSPFIPSDPKAYLKALLHNSAVCDCCFTKIRGEWFRCVYCLRDLCHDCLRVDTHDDTHLFIVFKSKVNMQTFRENLNIEGQPIRPPIIPYSVYHKLISSL